LLLIAGGLLDLNLQALADRATAMGVAWVDWRVTKDVSPLCHWDLDTHGTTTLPWGAEGPLPRGAFVRQDVFASLTDPRPEVAQRALGWFTAVQGWLMAQGEPPLQCRHVGACVEQARCAVVCAATWFAYSRYMSNDTLRMKARAPGSSIAKPVAGGGLCQTLEDALTHVDAACSAMPALIQPRLVAPEIRLFVVGDDAHAFRVDSPSLDYRAEQDAEVSAVTVPDQVHALRSLMRELRMDFGAADFKTDPQTGELVFLELNTSPMFARFDMACDGALTESMVRHLGA